MTNFVQFMLAVICVLSTGMAHAQSQEARDIGSLVSDRLLNSLANPKGTDYRVGVVNTALGTVMLISDISSQPAVEFISGYQSEHESDWNLRWSATEQVTLPLPDEFQFEIIRRKIGPDNCADLSSAIKGFYQELEQSLSATMTSLSSKPGPLAPLREVTVDGTTFPIQISTGRENVTVDVDRDRNTSLHAASGQLHMIVSGCANDVEGEIGRQSAWLY